MSLKKIDDTFEQMEIALKENKNLDEFSKLLSAFNKELNALLKDYAEKSEEEQKSIKPYTLFYRYFFEHAIYVTQSEEFFNEPDNYLKLINLIQNRKMLIEDEFKKEALFETENIRRVKPMLEKALKKRLEEQQFKQN